MHQVSRNIYLKSPIQVLYQALLEYTGISLDITKLLHSNGFDDWETYESSLGLYVTTLETLELFKWIREVLDMPVLLYSSFTVPSK